jgi:hypothetical protein
MTEGPIMNARDPLDIAERIVRLETKLDFIIAQMEKMPPSPTCTLKHAEIDEKIEDLERWRNRAIGAFLILNIFLVFATDKIKATLFGQP